MLLLTALIWGVAFVAQSVGMDYVGPFTFNAVRCIIGGIVLLPCIYFLGKTSKKENHKEESVNKKMLWLGGICCGTALFAATTVQQIGIIYTTVGKAGFITALYIIIVPIMGIFLKKNVPYKVWIGVALALAGLYLLCIDGSFNINKGDLLVMLCAFFFSIHILLIDYFTCFADGVKMSCIQFFVCGILSGIFMFILEEPNINNIIACKIPILYAGVLSCGVAYTLQIVAQKHTEPTVAALLLSLESVFAVIGGWIILSEVLKAKELIGCILIFIAVILAQLPSKENK